MPFPHPVLTAHFLWLLISVSVRSDPHWRCLYFLDEASYIQADAIVVAEEFAE